MKETVGVIVKKYIMGLALPPKLKFFLLGLADIGIFDNKVIQKEDQVMKEFKYETSGGERRVLEEAEEDYVQDPGHPDLDQIDAAVKKWTMDNPLPDQSMTLEDFSAKIGVSVRQLRLYYQDYLNKDFRSWKTSLRIIVAKRMLLEEGDMTIKQLALHLGFKDRSNFHRQFKSYVGCTPKTWQESGGQGAGNN